MSTEVHVHEDLPLPKVVGLVGVAAGIGAAAVWLVLGTVKPHASAPPAAASTLSLARAGDNIDSSLLVAASGL